MERAKKLIDEIAYQYDYSSRGWVAAPVRYANLPARDVPTVLLGEFGLGKWDYQCFHADRRQRMVWCAEHKRFEKVHHIERMDSIRSVDGGRKIGASCACAHTRPSLAVGCRQHGMVAYFSFCAPPIERKLTVPYRWRIIRYESGAVEVKADALRFCLIYTGENEFSKPQAEKYILHPRRITLGEVFDMEQGESVFCHPMRDWQDFGIDIPSVVTAKVFEHLQERAADGCNLLQESITDGVKKLRAFVQRPTDFHIEYWRDFFSAEEFPRLFPTTPMDGLVRTPERDATVWRPQNQQDNFSALCQALRLAPTENLRAAYEKNPYAPLWEKLLRFWGFKDDRAISYFYELSDFAGMRLPHFRFDRDKDELKLDGLKGWIKGDIPAPEFLEDTETVTAYEAHLRFAMLRFYVTWALLENKNRERAFAKRGLYALATKPWSNDLHEELDLFYWRFRHYCSYACTGEGGDNPWREIAADVERLSVMARQHLWGFNTEWFGWHWKVEHDRLMEEFHALGSPGKAIEERTPKKKLSRLGRILKIYDAMLTNATPLIPIKRVEYPPSMRRRDDKVIFDFDPSLWIDDEGTVHRSPRYADQDIFPPLPDDGRRTRLLAYRLFLEDCGYITAEIAEKIVGKKLSRRTFVRDLEFLRETCACGRLIYQAAEKIYVWESFGNATADAKQSHHAPASALGHPWPSEKGEENDSH